MLDSFGTWESERDGKIAALEGLLTDRYPDAKVLIFTEAADTANYVWEELLRRGVEGVGVVTGDSENPTALAQRFSPKSNSVVTNGAPVKDELRVLVSTDVLSEGQNLQDAHIIVNYDLPWAIVKLVQRAGRVDRIGQNSPEVLVYSLMPADEIEGKINLRGRIRERLGENARLLGSDETFFGDPTESQIISGVYDESSSYGLAGTGMDEVDPVSMAYEIWEARQRQLPRHRPAGRFTAQHRLLDQAHHRRRPRHRRARAHPDRRRSRRFRFRGTQRSSPARHPTGGATPCRVQAGHALDPTPGRPPRPHRSRSRRAAANPHGQSHRSIARREGQGLAKAP